MTTTTDTIGYRYCDESSDAWEILCDGCACNMVIWEASGATYGQVATDEESVAELRPIRRGELERGDRCHSCAASGEVSVWTGETWATDSGFGYDVVDAETGAQVDEVGYLDLSEVAAGLLGAVVVLGDGQRVRLVERV